MKNWLAISLVVVIASAIGFTVSRLNTTPVKVAQPVDDAQAATTDSKSMPATLPEFSLQNRDGKPQSIRSWPGKSMIINFWATWCSPCRKEIPLLKDVAAKKANEGFQVVGIAIDYRDDVLKYAEQMKIDYPILIGEQDGMAAADAFGVNSIGLPFTVFTDNKGRLVALYMGELTMVKLNLMFDAVARVNKGELTPDRARAIVAEKLLSLPSKAS